MTIESLHQLFINHMMRFEYVSPHTLDDLSLQISSCVDHMYHQGLDPHDLPNDTLVMDVYTPSEFSYLVDWCDSLFDETLEVY